MDDKRWKITVYEGNGIMGIGCPKCHLTVRYQYEADRQAMKHQTRCLQCNTVYNQGDLVDTSPQLSKAINHYFKVYVGL